MLNRLPNPFGQRGAPRLDIPKGSFEAVGKIWATSVYSQDPSLLGAKAWESLLNERMRSDVLGEVLGHTGTHMSSLVSHLCRDAGIQEVRVGALGGPGRSPLPGFPPVIVQAASHLCSGAIKLFHNNNPPGVGTSVDSDGAVTVFAGGAERVVWTPQVTPE